MIESASIALTPLFIVHRRFARRASSSAPRTGENLVAPGSLGNSRSRPVQ